MTYDITQFYNKTIFVDANAIIYHLQGLSPVAKDIFKLAEQKKVSLITTTRVIDEVIHKILLIRAREKFGITAKTIPKLRKDKAKVKALSDDIRTIYEFIRTIHLQVKPISYNDLKKLPDMMKSFGLLGSDSLILVMMNKFRLKFLLSSDPDFQNIDWITLIPALPEVSQSE